MEAYCFNCRAKREMRDTRADFFSNGSPVTAGYCTTCGNKINRMGRTPAHEGLTPPERKPRPPKAVPEGDAQGSDGSKPAKARAKRATAKSKAASGGGEQATTSRRGGPLVIVESPTKAKTIGRFLGSKFRVRPSVGHIRDLPKSRLGVDVDNDFAPSYIVPMDKRKLVKELRGDAAGASEIWLATDPDREGEAISWHLKNALAAEIEGKPIHRAEFHEITESAIAEAFRNPRNIDQNRVNAQQARRILDRLVGYSLSPLVSQKLARKGLSAGRVQSVALRLVVEREREIMAFVPVEYWSLEVELAKLAAAAAKSGAPQSFVARFYKHNGKDPDLKTGEETQAVVQALEGADYVVWKVDRRDRNRKPAAPFTTSTMQQEASRKIGFNARRTMGVAQSLYEGVDIGEQGTVGLITYMRTDSVNVSAQSQAEARQFIAERYGAEFVPESPPKYANRSKNAQEAHEAVRPTSVFRTPESLKAFLDKDQFKLYDLIWKRFAASQMGSAIYDATTVDIDARTKSALPAPAGAVMPPFLFRATGSIVKFAGFLKVYEESHDVGDTLSEEEQNAGKRLPELAANEALDFKRLIPGQHFTEPPPRYTEASLIRRLEEDGIGRPSTYASIMGVIQSRDYVYREGKQLRPTPLGFEVCDLLVGNFARYVDVGFTAHVEEELDDIETATREWVPVLHEFYDPFREAVKDAAIAIPQKEKVIELTGEKCPKCGEGDLIYRQSRYGRFIGCNRFPKCTHTSQIAMQGVKCPKCGGGLTEKRAKKGARRVFYGCMNYPTCDFTTWNKPITLACPTGDGGLMVEVGKGKAKCLLCESVVEIAGQSE